jgi:hypothetical protein
MLAPQSGVTSAPLGEIIVRSFDTLLNRLIGCALGGVALAACAVGTTTEELGAGPGGGGTGAAGGAGAGGIIGSTGGTTASGGASATGGTTSTGGTTATGGSAGTAGAGGNAGAAMGGSAGKGGSAGAAGGGGSGGSVVGACDWTRETSTCSSLACSKCTSGGTYCSTACQAIIDCVKNNAGCSTTADPTCTAVTQTPTYMTSECTSEGYNAGMGTDNDEPFEKAVAFAQCACGS